MILYENDTIVAIITGLTGSSSNVKTGDMAQIYILVRDQKPTEAIKNGDDWLICGDCVHRKDKTCYVNAGQGPTSVWKAYKKGSYPQLDKAKLKQSLRWKSVRFGAYGDPAFIPLDIVKLISEACISWTGYTHQWTDCLQDFKKYFMASVESMTEQLIASDAGWRSYRVINSEAKLSRKGREVLCPHESTGVQCRDCGLCDGTTGKHGAGKSIAVRVHGLKHKIKKFDTKALNPINL